MKILFILLISISSFASTLKYEDVFKGEFVSNQISNSGDLIYYLVKKSDIMNDKFVRLSSFEFKNKSNSYQIWIV